MPLTWAMFVESVNSAIMLLWWWARWTPSWMQMQTFWSLQCCHLSFKLWAIFYVIVGLRRKNALRAPFKARLFEQTHEIHYRSHSILMTYLMTSPQNVVDKPKQYMDIERPKRPIRMTGLRPTLSDSRLQWRTVHACVKKNRDCWQVDSSVDH